MFVFSRQTVYWWCPGASIWSVCHFILQLHVSFWLRPNRPGCMAVTVRDKVLWPKLFLVQNLEIFLGCSLIYMIRICISYTIFSDVFKLFLCLCLLACDGALLSYIKRLKKKREEKAWMRPSSNDDEEESTDMVLSKHNIEDPSGLKPSITTTPPSTMDHQPASFAVARTLIVTTQLPAFSLRAVFYEINVWGLRTTKAHRRLKP